MKSQDKKDDRKGYGKSPPSRGAWIEIGLSLEGLPVLESPPSRGAWIEIFDILFLRPYCIVAPLAGGVD